MSVRDKLDNLYEGILLELDDLSRGKDELVAQLKHQQTRYEQEIKQLKSSLAAKDKQIEQLKLLSKQEGNFPHPITPSSLLPISKKRKFNDQIVALDYHHEHASSSPTDRLSPIKQQVQSQPYDEDPGDLNATDDYLFARLPTQYSETMSSPERKIPDSELARLPTQYSVTQGSAGDPIVDLTPFILTQASTESQPASPEVIADSQEEENPLVVSSPLPLQDITNVTKNDDINTATSRMTPLQKRDYLRNHYSTLFHTSPEFRLNLSLNPIYSQRWALSDFIPNPKYVKPKLKRKLGRTWKEQANIDKFYKLAGPGVRLQSLRWNDDDDNDENEIRPEASQLHDRFPSPPGFNEVDFPTTQEEIDRKKYTETIQAQRIESRLNECWKICQNIDGGYIFREPILNEYVLNGRFYIDEGSQTL